MTDHLAIRGRPRAEIDLDRARVLLSDPTNTVERVAGMLNVARNTLSLKLKSIYGPQALRRPRGAKSIVVMPEGESDRWCIKCFTVKPLSDFTVHYENGYGRPN